ncbi:hypothetical protein SRHO_G00283550 [Serrasalmus rhombeus]
MAGSSGPRVRLMLTSAHKLLPPPLRSSRTNAERGRLGPRMAGCKLTSDSPVLQTDTASSWHIPPASKPSWKRIGMLAAVRKNFPRHVNVAMDVCQDGIQLTRFCRIGHAMTLFSPGMAICPLS